MLLWTLAGLVSLALAIGALVLDAAGLWWGALIFFGTAILSFVVLGFKVREELEYVRAAKPSAKRSASPAGKGAPLKDVAMDAPNAKSPARYLEDTLARCQTLSRKELHALAKEAYRDLRKVLMEISFRDKRITANTLADCFLLSAIAEDSKLTPDERRLFDSISQSNNSGELLEDRDSTRKEEFRVRMRQLCRDLPREGINALITLYVAIFMMDGEMTGRRRQLIEYFIG